MTTSNYDTTIATRVGLPIQSVTEFKARFENLPEIPDGLLFAKEVNLLRHFAATYPEFTGDQFTALSKVIDSAVQLKKRSGF